MMKCFHSRVKTCFQDLNSAGWKKEKMCVSLHLDVRTSLEEPNQYGQHANKF